MLNSRQTKLINWFCGCFILLSCPIWSQTSAKHSLFDLIANNSLREVTLKLDLKEMERNRKTVVTFPGVFIFSDSLGQSSNWDVELVVRGKFRRMSCDFPPLELKFSKAQLEERGLSKRRDHKLVTHCLADEKASDQIMLREYLIYRMYNILTDKSLRAQLLQVNYVDVKEPQKKKLTRYAILIEDEDDLGSRLNAEDCGSCRIIQPEDVISTDENVLSVFQYFIGNTDWSMTGRRNVKVYKPKDGTLMVPVPYDFDWSGFVDASYAVPNGALNLENVRERLFQGFPITKAALAKTLELFEQKKETLFQYIDDYPWLEKGVKNNLKKYLQSFYNRDAAKIPYTP